MILVVVLCGVDIMMEMKSIKNVRRNVDLPIIILREISFVY